MMFQPRQRENSLWGGNCRNNSDNYLLDIRHDLSVIPPNRRDCRNSAQNNNLQLHIQWRSFKTQADAYLSFISCPILRLR